MNRYQVSWKVKDLPFDPAWDFYRLEAENVGEAVRLAKQKWNKERENKYLNRCDEKFVKFIAHQI